MRLSLYAVLLAVISTVLCLGFAGGAGAAANSQVTCVVLGIPTGPIVGAGTLVQTASGITTPTCQAQLPAGLAPPSVATTYVQGPCRTVLTPSGRANEICQTR